jgi:hypothetical protein
VEEKRKKRMKRMDAALEAHVVSSSRGSRASVASADSAGRAAGSSHGSRASVDSADSAGRAAGSGHGSRASVDSAGRAAGPIRAPHVDSTDRVVVAALPPQTAPGLCYGSPWQAPIEGHRNTNFRPLGSRTTTTKPLKPEPGTHQLTWSQCHQPSTVPLGKLHMVRRKGLHMAQQLVSDPLTHSENPLCHSGTMDSYTGQEVFASHSTETHLPQKPTPFRSSSSVPSIADRISTYPDGMSGKGGGQEGKGEQQRT